jgi:hypothetical protein
MVARFFYWHHNWGLNSIPREWPSEDGANSIYVVIQFGQMQTKGGYHRHLQVESTSFLEICQGRIADK